MTDEKENCEHEFPSTHKTHWLDQYQNGKCAWYEVKFCAKCNYTECIQVDEPKTL